VKHSDFIFCVAANFLIVALEQGSGESALILKRKKRHRMGVVAVKEILI